MPPITPPAAPPGTPPGTPPTTPPEDGGGSSSSLIMAISLGIVLGAIKLPASNWRGITLTTLGASRGGRRRRRRGGGGATRKLRQLRSWVRHRYKSAGSESPPRSLRSGQERKPAPSRSCGSCRPSTNVCSNIKYLPSAMLFHGSARTLSGRLPPALAAAPTRTPAPVLFFACPPNCARRARSGWQRKPRNTYRQ